MSATETSDGSGEGGARPGTLAVVSTPIGNLSDLSARARETLDQAGVILCEDTRHTRKLTERYGIRTPLESYHQFNEAEKTIEVVSRLAGGLSAVLVCDAGTPGVSDPGYRLIRACREQGIEVVPIPGPSAAITALSVSGLPSDEFLFVGFLPPKHEARRRRLAALGDIPATLVFYEAPHRIRSMLLDAAEVLGPRMAFVGREMTKLHEEYLWGTLALLATEVREQGELVVVVEGARNRISRSARPSGVDLSSLSRQEVLKLAAERLGVKRGELYDALFRKRESD
jgi:16S rRNA (cytidine1402-2'-O)-methyltransferase